MSRISFVTLQGKVEVAEVEVVVEEVVIVVHSVQTMTLWNASSVAHVKLKDADLSIQRSLLEPVMWCTASSQSSTVFLKTM